MVLDIERFNAITYLYLGVYLGIVIIYTYTIFCILYSGKFYYNGEESEIRGNNIRVEFIKGYKDNPKINAFYIMRGKLENVHQLPLLEPEPVEEIKEEPEPLKPKIRRQPTGPKEPDPYTMDDSSTMLPILIAIGAFIPLLFCLCKL